jgi:RNA polymerase sigma factor (sigma-70 family)
MAGRRLTQVTSRLMRESNPAGPATETDRDLLMRFLQQQDEAAFEILVGRHDRLVRSAIAKVLSNSHDADDAFQATFLILIRRAKSIKWRAGLGSWLYGVAHRVAVKARDSGRVRMMKEGSKKPEHVEAPPDLSWREACALLHAELDKLPDRYRIPLLLCYLEGKTRDEVARSLRVTVGTVKGRLERGRQLLLNRLGRRGLTLSAGLFTAVACEGAWASSPSSISALVEAVRGPASARVLALARETAMSTILSKFTKSAIALFGLLVIVSVAIATGVMRATNDSGRIDAAQVDSAPGEQPAQQQQTPTAEVVTIKGHLIGPDKSPEAGATVAVWAGGKKLGETTTTKDNTFQVTVPGPLPAGARVVATKPGFAPDWANVPADPEKTAVELKAVPDDGAIVGQITDLEGKPLANLPVDIERIGRPKLGKPLDEHIRMNAAAGTASLYSLDSIPAGVVGLPIRVTTDKDGAFKIAGVGKDRVVRITTRGETTEHLQARIVSRELDAKLEQHAPFGVHGSTFTLRLAPSRPIVGTVCDSKTGDAVSGMRVAESALCETTTDKDGKFKLTGVRKQPMYHLNASSLGEAPYFDINIHFNDTEGLGEIAVTFKVHRGTVVMGRVSDTNGKPVAGQVFHHSTTDNLHLKDYPDIHRGLILSNWGELDRDGRYKLLVIPGPGAIGVHASPEDAFPQLSMPLSEYRAKKLSGIPSGHALATVNIDPNDPKTLTHDFTLTAGKTRDLLIRGLDGKLPDNLLAVWQTNRGQPLAPKPITDGKITLVGLSEKSARAVVLIDEAKTVGGVATVTGNAETPLTVTLEKLGSVTGRVLDSEGKPAADAEIRLWLLLDRQRFKITEEALAAFKNEKMPETVLSKLIALNDREFVHQQLPRELGKILGPDDLRKYRTLILNHAVNRNSFDNLPFEAFVFPGARYLAAGAWNDFTGRTAKTDKDGRFTVSGLLASQQYRLLAGFKLDKADGELLHDRLGLLVKPGETLELGELKPKK